MSRRGFSCVTFLVLALSACGSLQSPSAERLLQDGDCAQVPDIERLAITVSDHGTKVAFQWSGTRFAGTVQTSTEALVRDPSYGPNQAGEWEKRFPDTSAGAAVSGAYLGFPASSNPKAGVLAATVYDTRYPTPGEGNRGVAVVDLKTKDAVLLAAPTRVRSIALSPAGDYVAVVEIAPATKMPGWRDLAFWQKGTPSPRFDIHATVFATSGLAACMREVAAGVPSPLVNVMWRS